MKRFCLCMFLIFKSSMALNIEDMPDDMLILICEDLRYNNLGDIIRFFRTSKYLYKRSEYILPNIINKISPFSFPVFIDIPIKPRLLFMLNLKPKNYFFDFENNSEIEKLIGNKIIKTLIKDCGCFGLVLTKDNKLYSLGYNEKGELGLGDFIEKTDPTLIKGALENKKVISSFSNNHGCFALTSDGMFYAWGANNKGKLGLGHLENINTPTLLEGELKKKKIIAFASNDYRRMALTADGQIYWWSKKNLNKPQKLENIFDDQRIVWITSGEFYSLVLTQNGQIYNWGCEQFDLPSLIEGELKGKFVISITCGIKHSLALTKDGEVYAFGNNEYGQLGLGITDKFSEPKLINAFDGKKIKHIYTREHCSMAIALDNKTYVFGRNEQNQLGLGHNDNVFIPTIKE